MLDKSSLTRFSALCSRNEAPPPLAEERDMRGVPLPPYERLSARIGRDILDPPRSWVKAFHEHPLGDTIAINPIPLILSGAEYDELARGVSQIGRALAKFIEDVLLGPAVSLSDNGGFVPSPLMKELSLEATAMPLADLRMHWAGRSAKDIIFAFRPDIMRASWEGWRAIEINVGNLGGLADLVSIHQHFLSCLPFGLRQNFGAHYRSPVSLLPTIGETLSRVTGRVPIFGSNCTTEQLAAIRLMACRVGPFKHDVEYHRVVMGLERSGFRVLPEATARALCLEFPERCLFIPLDFDDDKELFAIPNTLQVSPPGVEMLGSKALLPYISQLIVFFLGERPVLEPALSVNARCHVVAHHPYHEFRPYFEESDSFSPFTSGAQFLCKEGLCDRGEGIILGSDFAKNFPAMCEEAQGDREYIESIENDCYLIQEYLGGSSIDGAIIDIAPHACYLGNGGCFVSPVPWGRTTTPPELNRYLNCGLTNVSCGGRELVVLVEK